MSTKSQRETRLHTLKLATAIITFIGVLITVYLKACSTSTSTSADNTETPSQKLADVINIHTGDVINAGDNDNITNDKRTAQTDDPNQNLPDGNNALPVKPVPASNQKTERSSQTSSKEITASLFNQKFKGQLALVDLENKNGVSYALNEHLKKAQYTTTTSFFRPGFFEQYKTKVWQQGIDILEGLSLPDQFRCACLLKEQINYEVKERFGEEFTVAKGTVELKILNLLSGEATPLVIPVGGSGADERRAYESFQSNFITEFISNNYLQEFEPCKN